MEIISIIFDELVKSRQTDGFVKSSPATGGTRRAKTEECGPLGAAATKLKRNAADGLFRGHHFWAFKNRRWMEAIIDSSNDKVQRRRTKRRPPEPIAI
jgi:hypothetical protein